MLTPGSGVVCDRHHIAVRDRLVQRMAPTTEPVYALTTWLSGSVGALEVAGRLYGLYDNVPIGSVLTDGASWNRAEVVEYQELISTCAMRRFRVVVRVLA